MRAKLSQVYRRSADRERLASLVRGGSPDRPIAVASAAVIEIRVGAMNCADCGWTYRLLEHVRAAPGVRRVDVECRGCSTHRSFWFRLTANEPN
ncbi:MAG: hypothetical protein AB7P03_21260 [Kofleriaceae bacterium]